MKINKPKFWDGKINVLSLILFPISLIYLAINLLRKKFYKENTFKIPIICVGNIYLGGTGKTPTSLFLANEILNSGKKTLKESDSVAEALESGQQNESTPVVMEVEEVEESTTETATETSTNPANGLESEDPWMARKNAESSQ